MDKAEPKTARLLRGALVPFRAAGLLLKAPRLWPLVLAPVLLTALFGLLAVIFGWGPAGALLGWRWPEPQAPWWQPVLWQAVHVQLYVGLVLVGGVVVPQVLTLPLQDLLALKVERRVRGQAEQGEGLGRFLKEIFAGLEQSLFRFIVFTGGQAVLLVFALVPVLNFAYPVLSFLWSARWLSHNYLGMTAALHLHTARETNDALAKDPWVGMGMGVVLGGLFLLPGANLFLVPIGVASGAVLYCDLVDAGLMTAKLPSSAGP
jgi:uncharacterized protein involved in cysteine biosynthesis